MSTVSFDMYLSTAGIFDGIQAKLRHENPFKFWTLRVGKPLEAHSCDSGFSDIKSFQFGHRIDNDGYQGVIDAEYSTYAQDSDGLQETLSHKRFYMLSEDV